MIEQINTQDLNFGTLVILAPNSTITNKEIRMLSGLKKLSIIRRGYGKNASIVNDILHETLLDAYCILKDIKRYELSKKLKIFKTQVTANCSSIFIDIGFTDELFRTPTLDATNFIKLYYAVESHTSWRYLHFDLSHAKNRFDIRKMRGINLPSTIIRKLNTNKNVINKWIALSNNKMDKYRCEIDLLMKNSIC